jgi:hypothetical protein
VAGWQWHQKVNAVLMVVAVARIGKKKAAISSKKTKSGSGSGCNGVAVAVAYQHSLIGSGSGFEQWLEQWQVAVSSGIHVDIRKMHQK